MKIRTMIGIACSILASNQSVACGDVEGPYFQPPHYIDVSYDTTKENETYFGQNGRFDSLVKTYLSPYRRAEEHDYESELLVNFHSFLADVRELLIAKGGNPKLVDAMGMQSCDPDYYRSALQFLQAAASDPDFTYDFSALVARRLNLLPASCSSDATYLSEQQYHNAHLEPHEWPESLLHITLTGPYGQYLEGAQHFHDHEYPAALAIFTLLENQPLTLTEQFFELFGKKPQSWLRETSRYMVGRCKLAQAQASWDGYSDPVGDKDSITDATNRVNQPILMEANAAFDDYLHTYPEGRYAASARHIKRRIWFLSNQQDKLNEALKSAMTEEFSIPAHITAVDKGRARNLIAEFKHYFHGNGNTVTDTPLVVAYAWLYGKNITEDDIHTLQKREADFSPYPGLFRYLQAWGYYKLQRYQELLSSTPDESVASNVLSLSSALLRAYALAHTGNRDEALKVFSKMHDADPQEAIELDIADMQLKQHKGLWLYTAASPVKENILRSVAQFGFTDEELHQGIASPTISPGNKQFLIDELAVRYLLTEQFTPLLALLPSTSEDVFSSIKTAVTRLKHNPKDADALADIGEFIYQSERFVNYRETSAHPNPLEELLPHCFPCQSFKERKSHYRPPIHFFHSVLYIAQRSGKKNDAEAKALHYLVQCEQQGSEFQDSCTWQRRYSAQKNSASKEFFVRLHRSYPHSPWTKKTPSYQ